MDKKPQHSGASRPSYNGTPRPQGSGAPRPQGASGSRPAGGGPRPGGFSGPRPGGPRPGGFSGPRPSGPRPAGPRPLQGPRMPRKEEPYAINERIRAREVRLVGDNVENGIYPIQQVKMATKFSLVPGLCVELGSQEGPDRLRNRLLSE